MSPNWRDWAVTFWAKDIPGRSWMYLQRAPDFKGAIIQARLRHLGLGRPEIDPTRTTVKER